MKNIEFTNHLKNEFINIRNSVNGNNEIEISGEIGQSWFSDGYTFDKFKNDLNRMESKIVINIKSMGGNLFEALAIYDHIRSLKNKVVTKIVGSSASAATIISLAGDKRYITENSRYLIHKPMIQSMGNSDDFEKVLNTLKDLDKQVVDLYVKRTKLNAEQVIELMREEKFISSSEAIEKGFIDDYVLDKDYQEENNTNKDIKNSDMTKEILDMLQVTNNTEAYDKIKMMLNTASAEVVENITNEVTSDEVTNKETEIVATQENASEDVINEVKEDDEEEVEKSVETESEKEDEEEVENKEEEDVEKEEEEEVENSEDEETVENLKLKINALEKSLKEKEDKEAKNKFQDFNNYLQEATNAGKITNNSHNDWVHIYNDKGEDFAKNLINKLPEHKITNTVDKVLEEITPNYKNKSKQEIMNDWKAGKITGEVATMLLK